MQDYKQLVEIGLGKHYGALIIHSLFKKPLTVTFTKKDGTVRVMRATLQPEVTGFTDELDAYELMKDMDSDPKINVWDIDNDGWRSFRLSQVIEVGDNRFQLT